MHRVYACLPHPWLGIHDTRGCVIAQFWRGILSRRYGEGKPLTTSFLDTCLAHANVRLRSIETQAFESRECARININFCKQPAMGQIKMVHSEMTYQHRNTLKVQQRFGRLRFGVEKLRISAKLFPCRSKTWGNKHITPLIGSTQKCLKKRFSLLSKKGISWVSCVPNTQLFSRSVS